MFAIWGIRLTHAVRTRYLLDLKMNTLLTHFINFNIILKRRQQGGVSKATSAFPKFFQSTIFAMGSVTYSKILNDTIFNIPLTTIHQRNSTFTFHFDNFSYEDCFDQWFVYNIIWYYDRDSNAKNSKFHFCRDIRYN